MLLTKQQLLAYMFAGDDKERESIQHLRVDPDGTVWATDGFIAARVHCWPDEPEDYAVGALGLPAGAHRPTETVYIPAAAARDVAQRLGKLRAPRPIFRHAYLAVSDEFIYLGCTDLDTPYVRTAPRPRVNYPAVERVMPNGPGSPEAVLLDTDYVARIARYRATFSKLRGKARDVRVVGHGALSPVSFHWRADSHEVDIVLAPIRPGKGDQS